MKIWKLILLTIFILMLCACSLSKNKESGCRLPPTEFTEKDLIGTWTTGSDVSDTLIFKEDGTYKQIIQIDTEHHFHYESDWQKWWVNDSEIGIPYVHLENMRLCVYWQGIECDKIGGGDHNWYDFCQSEWIKMPGEGILMVLGSPKGSPTISSVNLIALTKSTDYATGYHMIADIPTLQP
jgi:hypothetical protein